MMTILAALFNVLGSFIVLFAVWVFGKLVSRLLTSRQIGIAGTVGIGLGLVFATLLIVGFARIHFFWGLVILVSIAVVSVLVNRVWLVQSLRSGLQSGSWKRIVTLGGASLVGGLATLGLSRIIASTHSLVGTASFGNNDIPFYLQLVRVVRQTGFGKVPETSWPILNSDLSQYSATSYPGATVFLELFSPAQDLVGLFTVSAMAMAIAIQWLSILEIVDLLKPNGIRSRFRFLNWIVAAGATLSSLGILIAGQFFMGQVLGVAAMTGALAMLIRMKSCPPIRGFSAVALVAWVVVGVSSYPPIWLPLLGALLVYSLFELAISWIQAKWSDMRFWLWVGLSSFIVSLPLILSQWEMLISLSKGTYGWSTDLNNAIGALIDFDAVTTHLQMPVEFQIISWLVLGILAASAVWFGRTLPRRNRLWMLAGLILIGASMALANIHYGWGVYQSWKAMAYLFPIVLVLLYSSLVFGYGRMVRWITALGISAVLGLAAIAGALHGGASTTPDMLALRNDSRLREVSEVNVKLDPYFETMMVTALVPTERVMMASQSYLNASVDPKACSLVNADSPLATLPGAKALNATYSLTPWPGTCSTDGAGTAENDVPVSLGPVAELSNAELEMYFYAGWFPAETDGVWSTAESWLVLPAESENSELASMSVRLVFTAVPSRSGLARSVVFSGDEFTKKVRLSTDGTSQSVELPLAKIGRSVIHITSDVVVPSEVDPSVSDLRSLGIKVVAIE